MSLFVVDCEFDGGIIGDNSMVCFGVVKVSPELDKTFYGQIRPISDSYNPEALSISGFSREEHLKFDEPTVVMNNFANWIKDNNINNPILFSDNNGADASWINYYFLKFYGSNPFGWSSRRIGDLFCGAEHNLYYRWKKYRKTKHSHNPIDDAKGNAEALLYFFEKHNMKIPK